MCKCGYFYEVAVEFSAYREITSDCRTYKIIFKRQLMLRKGSHALARWSRGLDYPPGHVKPAITGTWASGTQEVSLVHMLWACACSITQSCPICDSMDCSPPGSPVHGICQAKILEWVAISFCKKSSRV